MSDITYITSFPKIPECYVSLVTIISSTAFTCVCDSNALFLRGKALSYVIGLLPIIFKIFPLSFEEHDPCLTPKPLHHTLHLPLDSSVSPETSSDLDSYSPSTTKLSFFCCWLLILLGNCGLFCSYGLPAPDYTGISSPKPTTNFSWTVTLIFFLRSSHLEISCSGLLDFRFLHLFLLKYY